MISNCVAWSMSQTDRGWSFLFPIGSGFNHDQTSTNTRHTFPCNLSGRAGKLQIFGVLFCIVAAVALSLTISFLSIFHGTLAITGGICFLWTGIAAIISSHQRHPCILWFVIILSIMSTLYAVVWIMAFQVIIATSHDRLKSFGEELGGSFPYLLASQYLISGLGAVLGLLTAAFATTLLREIPITSNAPLPIRSRSQLHPDQGRHLRLQSA